MSTMPLITLPTGETVPRSVRAHGRWAMPQAAQREVAALRLGLDLGMTLIDTAEMYANGGAEEVVAKRSPGGATKSFSSPR